MQDRGVRLNGNFVVPLKESDMTDEAKFAGDCCKSDTGWLHIAVPDNGSQEYLVVFRIISKPTIVDGCVKCQVSWNLHVEEVCRDSGNRPVSRDADPPAAGLAKCGCGSKIINCIPPDSIADCTDPNNPRCVAFANDGQAEQKAASY